jgi:hypothetical protein
MKLCFLIPYGKSKRKKRGSGRRKMGRKSGNLKSALSFVYLLHLRLIPPRAVAARSSAVNNPAPAASNITPKPAVPPQPPTTRKDKKSLKGVVVKRKTKPLPTTGPVKGTTGNDTGTQPDAKRRKL